MNNPELPERSLSALDIPRGRVTAIFFKENEHLMSFSHFPGNT
jgi:hypothetical protein